MNASLDLVEHYFRHEYGRLVGLLTSQLGARNMELAEDVVQSALSRALSVWPRQGIPQDPSAWLYRTAKNLAIDEFRRQQVAKRVLDERACNSADGPDAELNFDNEIGDETLRLLFLCCHPAIPPESQVAFSLKTVSGFSIQEIASGLMTTVDNVEKRLSRAKSRLREASVELRELQTADTLARIESVLSTVYLIFNEGYSATAGNSPIRDDLCEEAIRLARMLANHRECACPSAFGLLGLLLLHAARRNGRLDSQGCLVLLADQDRSLWDWELIRESMQWMQHSACGTELSRYHIEAAIAWEYVRAANFYATNWIRIEALYSMLMARFSTPMIRLNAAIACSYAESPERGREKLLAMSGTERKLLRPWWDCCMAQLYERMANLTTSLGYWKDALALAPGESQKSFIRNQIDRVQNRIEAAIANGSFDGNVK